MPTDIEYSEVKPPPQICSICLEDVDADDVINGGIPNCVTCKNGHFIHRTCFDKMFDKTTNRNCPQCRELILYNCSAYQGYVKPSRKGGKRTKTITKRRKNLRTKKITKKRKNLRTKKITKRRK